MSLPSPYTVKKNLKLNDSEKKRIIKARYYLLYNNIIYNKVRCNRNGPINNIIEKLEFEINFLNFLNNDGAFKTK